MSLEKTKKIDSETIIRKHVEVVKRPMHLIELNKGLNLRQQRFFNLAILKVENGISEISKVDFDEIFKDTSDKFYSGEVVSDVKALGTLGLLSGEGRSVTWDTVFIRVQYDDKKSIYRFEWSPYMKERIEDVRKNYIQQDLKTLAQFKNKYSFIFYDYFKSNYRQWKWTLTKEEVMDLLRVANIKTYINHHAVFFKQCIEVPVKEINEHTEYHITVDVIKKGRVVVGYEFKRFTDKAVIYSVSEKQLNVLKEIVDRYGDTTMLVREISSFAIIDADAIPFLTNLLFDIQNYQRFIQGADSFTSESFKDVVAMAIQKDNTFKAKMRELIQKKTDKPTIDDFLPQELTSKKKAPFYNWLEERE